MALWSTTSVNPRSIFREHFLVGREGTGPPEGHQDRGQDGRGQRPRAGRGAGKGQAPDRREPGTRPGGPGAAGRRAHWAGRRATRGASRAQPVSPQELVLSFVVGPATMNAPFLGSKRYGIFETQLPASPICCIVTDGPELKMGEMA
jgi:hypothetical protein